MTGQEEFPRIVTAAREIAASSERIFELIADPATSLAGMGTTI